MLKTRKHRILLNSTCYRDGGLGGNMKYLEIFISYFKNLFKKKDIIITSVRHDSPSIYALHDHKKKFRCVQEELKASFKSWEQGSVQSVFIPSRRVPCIKQDKVKCKRPSLLEEAIVHSYSKKLQVWDNWDKYNLNEMYFKKYKRRIRFD
jgi:hypothetical protein